MGWRSNICGMRDLLQLFHEGHQISSKCTYHLFHPVTHILVGLNLKSFTYRIKAMMSNAKHSARQCPSKEGRRLAYHSSAANIVCPK